MFVSYFKSAAPKHLKISIAKRPPRFFSGLHIMEFAPSDPFSAGDWRARYRADLDMRFPDDDALRTVLDRIQTAIPEGAILCCYEEDPATCHRTILAEVVRRRLGLELREWGEVR